MHQAAAREMLQGFAYGVGPSGQPLTAVDKAIQDKIKAGKKSKIGEIEDGADKNADAKKTE